MWVNHKNPLINFMAWKEATKVVSNENVCRLSLPTITWSIWLAYNKVLFKGKQWVNAHVFNEIKLRIASWKKARWPNLNFLLQN